MQADAVFSMRQSENINGLIHKYEVAELKDILSM